jgi:hypothetical protein
MIMMTRKVNKMIQIQIILKRNPEDKELKKNSKEWDNLNLVIRILGKFLKKCKAN